VSTLHIRATSGASGLLHTYFTWRYAILFYSLLLTLAMLPLLRALGLPTNLGSVSKAEVVTPIPLIYKVLFPSIDTFETPPPC
jgi:hypothetical protein